MAVSEVGPGAPRSTVQYSQGSTFGTTTSSSASFKNETSITNTSSFSFDRSGLDYAFSVGAAWGTTRTDQRDELITTTTFDQVHGPINLDGVDHGQDEIILWINPQVDIAFQGDRVTYSTHPKAGEDPDFFVVKAAELENPYGVMHPDVLDYLTVKLAIPVSDFAEMLKADPFANGSSSVDPNRFMDLHRDFTWRPPDLLHCNQFTSTTGGTWQQQEIVSTGYSTEHSTTTGYTVSASASFLGFLQQKFANTNKWTWTNASSTKTSLTTNATISVSVAQPSCAYMGPMNVKIYLDKIYHTYLFVTAY